MQKVRVTKTYFDKMKDRYFNPEDVFEVEEKRAKTLFHEWKLGLREDYK